MPKKNKNELEAFIKKLDELMLCFRNLSQEGKERLIKEPKIFLDKIKRKAEISKESVKKIEKAIASGEKELQKKGYIVKKSVEGNRRKEKLFEDILKKLNIFNEYKGMMRSKKRM